LILTLHILGTEILRIELGQPPAPEAEDPELNAVHRHSGEFGFGHSPAGPYWSHDPEEMPAVARED
jgi:hypothetical protein